MSFQSVWAQALLAPAHPTPTDLVTHNGSDPTRRLGVYRNNVVVSLVDALASTFPVTQQLLGEDFFRAMAQVFVRQQPPRSPVLVRYGEQLPAFIAHFAPAASVPYVGDVARLEWLRLQALHAADAVPLAKDAISHCMADPEALARTRWQLAPSLHLFSSPFAAVSLWAAHQEGSGLALESVGVEQAESAWIFRSDLDVMVLQTASGAHALAQALHAGAPLGDAVAQAQGQYDDLDVSHAMAQLLRHGLVVGLALAAIE
ncbi:MAG: DUF2063 domain-containing protein [Rhodoferax sp.]|nr:MAG: DUF2063 domain-containing protein [Rhodoferax sp.]